MITSRKRKNGRYVLLFLICVSLIGYFSYHAVEGNHGLNKRTALATRIDALETKLDALKQERLRIEHDVALMTARVATDPDLLDEQARSLLNYVRAGDIIVLRPRAGDQR